MSRFNARPHGARSGAQSEQVDESRVISKGRVIGENSLNFHHPKFVNHVASPPPTLLDKLGQSQQTGAITFAGQGAWDLDALAQWMRQSSEVNALVQCVSQRLESIVSQGSFRWTGKYTKGFDIGCWALDPARRPAESYLSSSYISQALIFVQQIACYQMLWEEGLSKAFLSSSIKVLTGHSQGIMSALLVAESPSGQLDRERFLDYAVYMLWQGRVMGECFEAKSSSADTSPMAAVSGPTYEQLQEAIQRLVQATGTKETITIALSNTRLRHVLSGPSEVLEQVRRGLLAQAEREVKGKKEGHFVGKPLSVVWEYLLVEAPFHSPYMRGGLQPMREKLKELGFTMSAEAFHFDVLSPYSATNFRACDDPLEQVLQDQFVHPVRWHRTLHEVLRHCPEVDVVLDLGPSDGVARLSHSVLKGTGVRVLPLATSQGREEFFVRSAEDLPQPLRYADFLPTVETKTDGTAQLHNRYTEATGHFPVILPGMTPTTADVGIVAAAANAGFTAELAGGGQVTERMFWLRMEELQEQLQPGREVVFNALYLDPYLWGLHFRKEKLVQKARAAGFPLCGVTISAGIPEVDEAAQLLRELQAEGLWLNAFKPGTYQQVKQVIQIAQSVPEQTLFVHLEGGKAGGHHSWENLDDLLLDCYHMLREQPNLVLCVGGGIGTEERSTALLQGTWSQKYGLLPMPVDAVFLGTLAMACLEAETSPQVKQALVDAAGCPDWVRNGEFKNGLTSGKSALNADIHYIDNPASRCGRLLDQVAGNAEAVAQRRDEIIEALNATAKPYFGNLGEMTYLNVAQRMMSLMCVGRHGRYEDGCWPDLSYRARWADFVQRIEARLCLQEEGTIESIIHDLKQLDNPEVVLKRLEERYPQAASVLLHPADVEYFLHKICSRPGKPVNFVPVIDENVRRWYKSDSLWQAHDDRFEANQVLILPGPEAVAGLNEVDEPIADLLGRFASALRDSLLSQPSLLTQTKSELLNISEIPAGFNWEKEGQLLTLTAQNPATETAWFPVLYKKYQGPIAQLLRSRRIFVGRRSLTNPLYALMLAKPGATLTLARKNREIVAVTYSMPNSSEEVRLSLTPAHIKLEVSIPEFAGQTRNEPYTLLLTPEKQGASYCFRQTPQEQREAVRSFYHYVLFGELLEPTPLFGVAEEKASLSRERVRGYHAVTGGKASTSSIPRNMMFSLVWKPLFRTLSCDELVGDIFQLVHLNNRVTPLVEEPIQADEELLVRSQISRLEDSAQGRTVYTTNLVYRGDQPCLWVESAFFIRGSFAQTEGIHQAPQALLKGLPPLPQTNDVKRVIVAQAQDETPSCLETFAEISRDGNPIHRSTFMARLGGLEQVIVHGMWTAARLEQFLIQEIAAGKAERLQCISAEFLSYTFPGEPIVMEARRTGVTNGALWFEATASAIREGQKLPVARLEAQVAPPLTAYVFPGQGIQQKGMGMAGYNRSKAARSVWDRSDAYTRKHLGFSILHIVRNNPSEVIVQGVSQVHPKGVLHLTQFTQVAMAVLAQAQIAEMKEAGIYQPDAVICGHSVGEYNAIAVTGVLPLETVVELVYQRGQVMHLLVKRNAQGESGYGMAVIRPHYAGMNHLQAEDLVQEIHRTTGHFLQIVNYNVKGRQYSVTGRVEALQELARELATRTRGSKPAYLEIPGIDVPFHSSVLRDGVAQFRNTLHQRLPEEIDYTSLLGRYIPNLVPRPFSLEHSYVQEVADYTQSPVLQDVIENFSEWQSAPAELARTLLIELLAWQFASPVRWIETQDLLLGEMAVERIVEIGVGYQPTLANMARYSLKLLGPAAPSLPIVNIEAEMDQVFFQDDSALEEFQVEQEDVVEPELSEQVETSSAPAAAAPTTTSYVTVEDRETTAAEALRILLALQAKVRLSQVRDDETIDELFDGVSSRRNQVLLDLGAEFNIGPIDGAHEKPLHELAAEISKRASQYKAPGKYLRGVQDEAIKRVLGRAGLTRKDIRTTLDSEFGMGEGLSNTALLHLALETRSGQSKRGEQLGALAEPIPANRSDAKALLEKVVATTAAALGVSLSKKPEQTGAAAVDAAVVQDLEERILGSSGVLMNTARQLAQQLGHSLEQGQPLTDTDESAERLSLWEREHGEGYEQWIQPRFDAQKHVAFSSSWAWIARDIAQLYHDVVNQRIDEPQIAQRLGRLSLHASLERTQQTARWYAQQAQDKGLFTFAKQLKRLADQEPFSMAPCTPSRPSLRIADNGSLQYEEAMQTQQGAFHTMLEQWFAHNPLEVQGWNSEFRDALYQSAKQPLSFSGETALVTGASPGSIAVECVRHLLRGGARVVVTTSTYNGERIRFYRSLYEQEAAPGAELHLVPFNQSSFQDVESLVEWLFSSVQEQNGADIRILKRPFSPSLLLPFAAVKDLGTLDNLGPRSNVVIRAMLLSVERMIAGIASRYIERGLPALPCHVVLPLSPNHGTFGGDGVYAETKAALEVLQQKWFSEHDAWGQAVTLCAARIGWVRGTGLMDANNPVAARLEEQTGVTTFSSPEMGLLLSTLCTQSARSAARHAPLQADLSGGFAKVENLKEVVDGIRQSLEGEQKLQRNEATPPQKTSQVHALPQWPDLGVPQEFAQEGEPNEALLANTVVIVGTGEVGPCGSSRTRFALEVGEELSPAGVLELAWVTGMLTYDSSGRGGVWRDTETGEEVAEWEIASRYRDAVRECVGVRFCEEETLGFAPQALPVYTSVYLEKDFTFPVASADEARSFVKAAPEQTSARYCEESDTWQVTRKAGSEIRVPRESRLRRNVAGMLPKGFCFERYGIPKEMLEQVDRVSLFNLIATVDAFVSAGLSPEELMQWVHPARVANTQGSGIGGMQSLRRLYQDHILGEERQSDILQETLINVVAAYVVQSYVGSYGAMSHPVAACATAAVSLEDGMDKILAGKADFVVTGGFDDLGAAGMIGFADMNATADTDKMLAMGLEPSQMSRANDARRRGFVEAQGGGTVLLARGDVALRMGLPVQGVLAYAASFGDGIHKSIPAPGMGALASVMGGQNSPLARALQRYGMSANDIALVSKHDTSTNANDPNENQLHHRIQEALDRTPGNPLFVVSQKALTGHPKGGAAAWQVIGLCQSLQRGVIPGNRNLDCVDKQMMPYTHMAFNNRSLHTGAEKLKAGLVTSLGFGHVSGIALILHPDTFGSLLSQEQRCAHQERARLRQNKARQDWAAIQMGQKDAFQKRSERRFVSADGTSAQAEEEASMLLSPNARLSVSERYEPKP